MPASSPLSHGAQDLPSFGKAAVHSRPVAFDANSCRFDHARTVQWPWRRSTGGPDLDVNAVDLIGREDLAQLAEFRDGMHVSLYASMVRAGP
jgi:hypothetical protein